MLSLNLIKSEILFDIIKVSYECKCGADPTLFKELGFINS